jgi:phosphate transport system permease protein
MNRMDESPQKNKDANLLAQGNNLSVRNRKGKVWHIVFLAATLVAILVLTALLWNIFNSAFGYVAYEFKVDPAQFVVDGILPEKQTKEQLVSLLQSELSSGAYNKLNNEKTISERTQNCILWLQNGS